MMWIFCVQQKKKIQMGKKKYKLNSKCDHRKVTLLKDLR